MDVKQSIQKVRDMYDIKPGAPFHRREFGFYSLEEWKTQGMPDIDPYSPEGRELFMYDEPGACGLWELGWCEASFSPAFEVEVLEDRGKYELVRDSAGREVLYFKNKRSGFMPEYVNHPLKDEKSWEEHLVWRLDPESPERYRDLEARMGAIQDAAGLGMMVTQHVIGGCMYLRSLFGPTEILYAFYDMPGLIHKVMETWLSLADYVIAKHQEYIDLDILFLAEDICYNKGLLYSPDTVREFLFPYYQELIKNIRHRQKDRTRKLHIQIDTDGYCVPMIDLYREGIGMNSLTPFEVASGCDVVAIGREYPELVMSGGIDKRILTAGKAEIDRELERILPVMRKRGGYAPTCDHGVPAEVSYGNYLHYRKRCVELGG
ncbi:MAG: uroporphyrinogen decarboxylase family protein [Spirochaetia bacterium]